MSLRAVKQMTEVLEKSDQEENLENQGLDENQKMIRQLKNTKDQVVSILKETALPMAAYGVKFLAKIFGDLTLSKLFSHQYLCL